MFNGMKWFCQTGAKWECVHLLLFLFHLAFPFLTLRTM